MVIFGFDVQDDLMESVWLCRRCTSALIDEKGLKTKPQDFLYNHQGYL